LQKKLNLKQKIQLTLSILSKEKPKTGWKVTHRIKCPLSSERMSGDQVQKMQKKRILGTAGRRVIIARRWGEAIVQDNNYQFIE